MIDLIQCARNKLDDPIIMTWALRTYEHTCRHTPELAEKMVQMWFDDLTLSQWIRSDDHDCLSHMFTVIPVDRFGNVRNAMIDRWPDWCDAVAGQAVPALITNNTDQIYPLFKQHIATHFSDSNKTFGIIKCLADLAEPIALDLLDQMTKKTLQLDKQDFNKSFFMGGLLNATIRLNPDKAEPVFVSVLGSPDTNTGITETLRSLTHTLFGNDALFDLATWIKTGKAQQSFSSLKVHFSPDAPLAECDNIIGSHQVLSSALQLLDKHKERTANVQLSYRLVKVAESILKKEALVDLGCFALASTLHSFLLDKLDTVSLTLDEAIRLLSADLSVHFHRVDLTECIVSFDTLEIVSAIEQRLPHVKDYYGSIHLAQLAGELKLTGLIPTLIHSLKDGCGDFLCAAAQKSLVKLGELAQSTLMDQWDTLDRSQAIYGGGVIREVGGQAAADFATTKFDTLFFDDLEFWCALALAMPDLRLVELLEPEVKRKQSLIDEAYYRLCVLLAHPTEKLSEIHDRIIKLRKEQHRRLTAMMGSASILHDSVNMLLRCHQCGIENHYQIKKILLSDSTDYPHVIVDEFQCVSCEAWTEFDLTGEATMAVAAELLISQAEHSEGSDGQGPFQLSQCIYRGEKRTVAGVINELESSVAQHGELVDYLELGRTNQLVGRLRKARACYQRVCEKEPDAMEAGLGLAYVDAKQGKVKNGFKRLNQLLRRQNSWRFYRHQRLRPAELGEEFVHLYNDLHKRLGIKNHPVLHATFMGKFKKIGRNDLCLCGSGKKYKKCCLLKA